MSIYLALFNFLLYFLNTSVHDHEAIPLITVEENQGNGEAKFVLNPVAISMIKQLSSPVKVIAAIGDARVGKSTALNFIHYTLNNVGTSISHAENYEEIFKTGNTMAAVTHGVWISTVQIPGKHGIENVILLDVEGTDLGDDTVTDKLSIFTALTSSSLTLFMKEFPSAHILDFLYKIVRLSKEAFGKKESDHFPQLTAVLRGALEPPESYDSIDKYIIDTLVTPKWKDKSDEKRKAIGRRFPKESISVFNLPFIPNPQINFQSILESSRHGYLNAIEKLTSKLLKLPEKKTLSGGLMDGQALADLAQRLVSVMNNHEEWHDLNPSFYYLFEKEVCRKSEKKHIQPLLGLSSQEIERRKFRALNNFKSNCNLEEYLVHMKNEIQSTLERKRDMEKRELKMKRDMEKREVERKRDMEKRELKMKRGMEKREVERERDMVKREVEGKRDMEKRELKMKRYMEKREVEMKRDMEKRELKMKRDMEKRELEMKRDMEKRELKMKRELEAERERNKGIVNTVLGIVGGGIVGAAGYAWLAPLLSDVQLKENINVLNNSEYETIGLRGVEWVWNQEAESLGLSGKETGVVAQEVELLYPWAVTEGYDGYKRVNYLALRLLIWVKKFQHKAEDLINI